ncbi:tripartite tricarboxylate transporter substrate binding protein [Paenirhodobacter populi]|uniref:Tripartite tricarboxylate transporter substrate binding protein n=1 Tax=Paenirhodobacter populi TaxID=2306993 RepID=A0A443J9W2_9RHOB|nr:tripartite tricarboxylate transporter substrate binding protein [Sinirhodobacter populi]RWR17321.1 tripartite tricarboxylate transporter substrate binding protein [Sinirhodobacter populi]
MKFKQAIAGLLLGLLGTLPATAQNYPARNIEVIVPTAAGGGTDLLTRSFVDHANKLLAKPMGVVNKPGGGGAVGLTDVARARPNGYKLAMGFVEITILPHLGIAPFKVDDFRPIARINAEPAAITVRADSSWQTLEDFVAAAKEKPNTIRVGSSGTGSIYHLAAVAFGKAAGAEFNNVPFEGANPAVTTLIGGHIEAVSVSPAEVSTYVEAGQLRLLGVMDKERSALFPEIPTMSELGYDVSVGTWRGLLAPKNTPDDVINTLREVSRKVAENPEFQAQMKRMNMTEAYLDAPEFAKAIAQDDQQFGDLISNINLVGN